MQSAGVFFPIAMLFCGSKRVDLTLALASRHHREDGNALPKLKFLHHAARRDRYYSCSIRRCALSELEGPLGAYGAQHKLGPGKASRPRATGSTDPGIPVNVGGDHRRPESRWPGHRSNIQLLAS